MENVEKEFVKYERINTRDLMSSYEIEKALYYINQCKNCSMTDFDRKKMEEQELFFNDIYCYELVIPEDMFDAYIEEDITEVYDIPGWLTCHIDWEAVAEQCVQDYETYTDTNGDTFYCR